MATTKQIFEAILKKLDELLEAIKGLYKAPKPEEGTLPLPEPTEPVVGPAIEPNQPFPEAYTQCKQMWEAAQRAGKFWIYDYIDGMQSPAKPPVHPKYYGDMAKLERDIVAIGFTDWGKEWLSHDENAVMLGRTYQRLFLNYYVQKGRDNLGNTSYTRIQY